MKLKGTPLYIYKKKNVKSVFVLFFILNYYFVCIFNKVAINTIDDINWKNIHFGFFMFFFLQNH